MLALAFNIKALLNESSGKIGILHYIPSKTDTSVVKGEAVSILVEHYTYKPTYWKTNRSAESHLKVKSCNNVQC